MLSRDGKGTKDEERLRHCPRLTCDPGAPTGVWARKRERVEGLGPDGRWRPLGAPFLLWAVVLWLHGEQRCLYETTWACSGVTSAD